MGQRSHRASRCARCRLHLERCQCQSIPSLPLQTRVVLVMHHREPRRPTATGPLALEALPNHALLLHGRREAPAELAAQLSPARRGLLLFPAAGARVLSGALLATDPRPVTLVVPDGSWRQASKAARRLPGMDRLEPVVLPAGPESRYRLRREPKPGGLATMEAIARALGIIEGQDIQRALEALFERVIEQTLEMRQQSSPRS